MPTRIDPSLVSIRELTETDVPRITDYWFHSPPGFIEHMGVDPTKLPSETQMAASLTRKIQFNRNAAKNKMHALAITYENKFVGIHAIYPLTEGEEGIFHAHIMDTNFRGRGIGMESYPKACLIYFEVLI